MKIKGFYFSIYVPKKTDYIKFDVNGKCYEATSDYTQGEDWMNQEEKKYEIRDDKIYIDDWLSPIEYTIYKDFLVHEPSMMKGRIPEESYFDATCVSEKHSKIIFHADGTAQFQLLYKPSDVESATYKRKGELLQLIVSGSDGRERKYVYLVYNSQLVGDAMLKEESYHLIEELDSMVSPKSHYVAGHTEIISKEEFFNNYPCQFCNARKAWNILSWDYEKHGSLSVSGRCKKCNGYFVECESPEDIKKIAYRGSKPNPYYREPAGTTHYLDNPCPYCGAFQVRYAKWSDKQMSTAFWGFFSQKLHSNYKCEKCGKMWE